MPVAFLRKRRIVMDDDMLRTPRILERIFVHEVFHFVWLEAGRAAFALPMKNIVSAELDRAARGELGWSAESLKMKVTEAGPGRAGRADGATTSARVFATPPAGCSAARGNIPK